MEKIKKAFFRTLDAVERTDIYGLPIRLTLEGHHTFKSTFGGFMTIGTALLVSLYLMQQLQLLFNRESVISNLEAATNVIDNPSHFFMGPENFSAAARLYWVGSEGYPDPALMDRYFRVHFGSEAFEWDPLTGISAISQDPLRGIPCQYEDFRVNSNSFDQYNLGAAICPAKEEQNFMISGQWSSKEPAYYKMQIYSCRHKAADPDTECEKQSTIEDLADALVVDLFILNKYFDGKDFDNHSIKDQIQYYYLPMDSERGQGKVFTVRQGTVKKDDSWASSAIVETDDDLFYSVHQDYDYSRAHRVSYQGQSPWYLAVWFLEDLSRQRIRREALTIVDILSKLGGLVKFLSVLMTFLTASTQTFLLESYIISKIFLESTNSTYAGRTKSELEQQRKIQQISNQGGGKLMEQVGQFKEFVLQRQPFRYRYINYLKVQFGICCCKPPERLVVRRRMYFEARKRLREEFDILQLITHQRKFNLMKLILLRQYQRRILKFSKKQLIKPPKPTGFRPPKTITIQAESLEQLEYLHRVMDGAADPENLVDEKLLKNLLPKKLFEEFMDPQKRKEMFQETGQNRSEKPKQNDEDIRFSQAWNVNQSIEQKDDSMRALTNNQKASDEPQQELGKVKAQAKKRRKSRPQVKIEDAQMTPDYDFGSGGKEWKT